MATTTKATIYSLPPLPLPLLSPSPFYERARAKRTRKTEETFFIILRDYFSGERGRKFSTPALSSFSLVRLCGKGKGKRLWSVTKKGGEGIEELIESSSMAGGADSLLQSIRKRTKERERQDLVQWTRRRRRRTCQENFGPLFPCFRFGYQLAADAQQREAV